MIVYRVYNENGGYTEYTEIPQGVEYEVIDKTPTPEEIVEANNIKIKNLKLQQYEELFSTDWYYTRFLETGQEVPLEIKQLRQEIRNKYNTLIENLSLNL